MESTRAGKFIDNEERKRFELHVDGFTAFAEYIINKKGVIYLTHTEVPKQAEGKGISGRLLNLVFQEIERRGLELVPICPFVKVYLQRNPEWKRLLTDFAKF